MTESHDIEIGELFARQYIARTAPLQDGEFFRQRLGGFVNSRLHDYRFHIATYVKMEGGYVIEHGMVDSFFNRVPVEHVLSCITLVWQYLQRQGLIPAATEWREFVARAMREENMAYSLDAKCGVHFFVDEQFERNRVTALASLAGARYAGVRVAYDQAHSYLDSQPPDTKAAVRSAFESLEILARLMDSDSKNLNRWMVENQLKPLAVARAANSVEATAVAKMFDGIAQFVDGIHNYRHGQGVEDPVAPSMATAVYVVSSVASALRLLASLDQAA